MNVGDHLGPFLVLGKLGEGGMGEVYRARDPKLNRDVAIKTLPAAVSADPDRLARFKREAQVLASLNHSHIAGIYGFEEADGAQALVLELVEGPTLADRIALGPIPLEEAVPIAVQIADALEAAHARGIVHRDLKPANIKVRPDGTVKVLDFGLAKALSSNASAAEVAATPTVTSPALTRLGVVLGTAAYMSPEQARGKEADKRSDIWAFGCVLYEMLTGRRAFEGSEVSDTLAAILKSDPEWNALPADVPAGVRRILRRCLEKDARRRYHDIADVRLELEEARTQDASTALPAVRSKVSVRERVAWSLVALLVVLFAGVGAYVALKPPRSREVVRFAVYPPPDVRVQVKEWKGWAAVSPDGTRLVFVGLNRAGQTMLWLRPFESFDAVPLAGTDGASFPFWDPHAGSVAFFVGTKLKRVSAAGGSPQTICDVGGENPRGGTWGSAGEIVFSVGQRPRLYRVSAESGAPVPLATQADRSVWEGSWPYFLPDGRTFLYWAPSAEDGPGVYVASTAANTAPQKLETSESNASYDPAGFLLFTRGGALLQRRFNPSRLKVSGETRPIANAERVAGLPSIGFAAFSVSNTGVLAFQPDWPPSTQFAWFDRDGDLLETVGAPGTYLHPTLSPEGRRLVYTDASDGNLWMFDMSRQFRSLIPTGPGMKTSPAWSHDGKTIFYRKGLASDVPSDIYETSASGAAEEKLFFKGIVAGPSQVSPDGKWLLYFGHPEAETVFDIYVLPTTGDKKPQRIVHSPFADVEPRFSSPKGNFIAYASNETGRYEVFVQPFPPTGERWMVSNKGGRQPLWRMDGKELFFVSDDRKLYAVQIKPGPTFDHSTPQFLFDMRANVTNVRNSYFPSPDGQRFLVNMTLDTTALPIHVTRNWTAGLRD